MNKEDREYFTRCMADITIMLAENNKLLTDLIDGSMKDIIFNLSALGWAVVAIMFIGALFMLFILM